MMVRVRASSGTSAVEGLSAPYSAPETSTPSCVCCERLGRYRRAFARPPQVHETRGGHKVAGWGFFSFMLCFWYDGFIAFLFLTFSWCISGGGWMVYHPTVWRREAVNGAMPVKRDARGRGGDALRGGHCGTQSAQLVHRSHHVVRTTEDTVVFNRTAMAAVVPSSWRSLDENHQ